MKTIKNFAMLLAAAAFITVGIASCNKKPVIEAPADLTELNTALVEAQKLYDNATSASYKAEAITDYKATVDAIKRAIAGGVSQSTANNLLAQLKAAIETLNSNALAPIPASAITFALNFNKGVGESLTTAGTNTWKATLEKGPAEVFGNDTSIPTFVDGKVGKAMHFENGSHLKIEKFAAKALEGSKLSIAVWVNPDKAFANNYIISYNTWNTWKFQIQDGGKPFFTVATDKGITDMDNEHDNSAPAKTWTHIVVTFDGTSGNVEFFINGELTKTWTVSERPNLAGSIKSPESEIPLLIGAGQTIETALKWEWDSWKTPEGWSNFYGSLDELKVYNIALTAGQVSKIYNDEK